MNTQSRTQKSVTNIAVALIFTCLTLVIGFFSRKIFIEHLGSEIIGLTTTVTSLLGFLNLAELGIGAAISFALYKPLAQNDDATIREIIAIQGIWYKRIAIFIIGAAAILCFFFPLMFKKSDLPLWNAYACFAVLLFSSLLGYFFNYKQIILSASQQQHKITSTIQTIRIIKLLLQILGISLINYGYVYWLFLELFAAIASCIALNKVIYKNYPHLKTRITISKLILQKHSIIKTKTKQILFHRLSGFILYQSSPLIIFAFLSLNMVTIYGNYMLILTALFTMFNTLRSGLVPGIGNLVADGNQERILQFFKELLSSVYCISSIICFCFFILATPFISVWFGEQFTLNNLTVIFLAVYMFFELTRTCTAFLPAYGLFGDIWAPPIEGILNLGLSISLGYYFGLTGILAGVCISLFLAVYCWKPYYLFHKGFNTPFFQYVVILVNNLFLIGAGWFIMFLILPFIYQEPMSIYQWIKEAIKLLSVVSIIHISLFYFLNSNFRKFATHITHQLTQRLRKREQLP